MLGSTASSLKIVAFLYEIYCSYFITNKRWPTELSLREAGFARGHTFCAVFYQAREISATLNWFQRRFSPIWNHDMTLSIMNLEMFRGSVQSEILSPKTPNGCKELTLWLTGNAVFGHSWRVTIILKTPPKLHLFGTVEDETLEETKSCAVHGAGDLVPANTHLQLPNSSEKCLTALDQCTYTSSDQLNMRYWRKPSLVFAFAIRFGSIQFSNSVAKVSAQSCNPSQS